MDNAFNTTIPQPKTLQIIIVKNDADFDQAILNYTAKEIECLIGKGIHTPNVTAAYGQTFFGAYQKIPEHERAQELLRQCRFFELDEVYPTETTYRRSLEDGFLNNIFGKAIPKEQWVPFYTKNGLEKAREIMREAQSIYGVLDLAILGMGGEGDDHYGLVRGGIKADKDLIIPALSPGMIKSFESYNDNGRTSLPTHGISFAHAALPENIIFSAKGKTKAVPAYNFLCAPCEPDGAPEISTTFVRNKQRVTLILDKTAASMILENTAHLPDRTEIIEYNP